MIRSTSIKRPAFLFAAVAVFALGHFVSGPVRAQVDRDPTRAPLQSQGMSSAGAPPQQIQTLPLGLESLSVVVRDGSHYLVYDTRLYAVGQTVGGFKIERITETEAWLRSGRHLTKVQRFSGIQRRAAQP